MVHSNLELNLIHRQFSGKKKFPDYDRAIKELQCHQVNSFLPCTANTTPGLIYDYDVPVYSCKFSPTKTYQSILAIANENGTVCVENADVKNSRTYVQAHNNSVFDLAWMPGENKFVTVSGDHTAKLWACTESEIKMVSEFEGHCRSVKCVYFKPEDTAVFATGSRDGSLILWDTRSSKKTSQLPCALKPDQIIPSAAGTSPFVSKKKHCPKDSSKSNSVTGLIFQNDNTLISSGSFDQCIRIWDMRKTYSRSVALSPLPKHQLFAPNRGFSHICINPFGTKLYANCMDSYIYCFNLCSYDPEPVAAFYGHQNGSFYVKSNVSYDGVYLMSGSTDKYAYIWNTRNAELSEHAVKPLVVLPGHNAEVVCIAMSFSGNMNIASCSDDGTYRLWRPYKMKENPDEKVNRDNACSLDWKTIDTVRFQWRNKRKLDTSAGPDPVPAKIRDRECFSHSKICRFYNKNLPSSSCICQEQINPLKRRNSEDERNEIILKRRCKLELQERTPPRIDHISNSKVTPTSEESLNRRCHMSKITSKRKLADMPNFIEEENKNKKLFSDRVLSPIKENKQAEKKQTDVKGVDAIGEYNEKFNNLINECNSDSDEEIKTIPEFSSPTMNLPNYVKDGSSPYLHRCPKNHQKENVDWLTKLLKENPKHPKNVTPENKKSTVAAVTPTSSEKSSLSSVKRKLVQLKPSSPTTSEKLSTSGVKRRLTKVKSSPAECRNMETLHKYFKTSSKPSEINFMAQEMQKKDIEVSAN